MTIERGNFQLRCNRCGEVEDLDTTDFEEAKEGANRLIEEENWTQARIDKAGGVQYTHICPQH